MADIFISHVEEDADVALAIAGALEAEGLSTWYYERDSVPGLTYLVQVCDQIDQSRALVLVISPDALGSNQMTVEVARGHESSKRFIPVLKGITHAEFQVRQPEWRAALGTTASLAVPPEGVAEILPRIVKGAKAVCGLADSVATEPPSAPPVSAGASETLPAGPAAATQKSAAGRRRWLWGAMLALCVALAGIGIHFAARQHPAVSPTAAPSTPESASQAPSEQLPLGKAWEVRQGAKAGEEITGPDGGKMVWVPAGEFEMGANDGEPDQRPVHRVRITKGFWLGRCPVTNAQYRRFCREIGSKLPPPIGEQGDDFPAIFLTWERADAYCTYYGLALPTEAQWEYAARGPEGRKYPWGNEWDPKRCANSANRAAKGVVFPAGSFPEGASWCGALDMAGNVAQWCKDRYDERYYAISPKADPPGPGSGEYRTTRGGTWSDEESRCASYRRDHSEEDFQGVIGIRTSRTP